MYLSPLWMGCQHRPCSSPLADGAVWPYCGQGEFLNFSKRQEFSEVVNGAGWWGRSRDLGLVSLRACARKIGAVRASGSEDFWDPGWWSRKLKASILQGCHWHACILCWSPSFAPCSSFLPLQTLGSDNEGSRGWVPTSYTRDFDGIPDYHLWSAPAPAVAGT